MSASAASQDTGQQPAPKMYAKYATRTAASRFWRAAWIFLIVIIVNTAIQAVLIAPNPIPSLSIGFIAYGLLSYLVLLVSLALLVSAALQVPYARPTLATTLRGAREHFGLFAGWTAGWTVVAIIGFSIYTIPGWVILLLTPFVPLAAADGQRNALAANFRAMGARTGRYLATLLASAIVLVGLYVFSGLIGFLLPGVIASVCFWLVAGIVGTWLLTAWALLYRSTPVGAEAQVAIPAPA